MNTNTSWILCCGFACFTQSSLTSRRFVRLLAVALLNGEGTGRSTRGGLFWESSSVCLKYQSEHKDVQWWGLNRNFAHLGPQPWRKVSQDLLTSVLNPEFLMCNSEMFFEKDHKMKKTKQKTLPEPLTSTLKPLREKNQTLTLYSWSRVSGSTVLMEDSREDSRSMLRQITSSRKEVNSSTWAACCSATRPLSVLPSPPPHFCVLTLLSVNESTRNWACAGRAGSVDKLWIKQQRSRRLLDYFMGHGYFHFLSQCETSPEKPVSPSEFKFFKVRTQINVGPELKNRSRTFEVRIKEGAGPVRVKHDEQPPSQFLHHENWVCVSKIPHRLWHVELTIFFRHDEINRDTNSRYGRSGHDSHTMQDGAGNPLTHSHISVS